MKFLLCAALLSLMAYGTQATATCVNLPRKVCPTNYQPVCGRFIMTFSNQCVMESLLCEMAQEGFQYLMEIDGDCCSNLEEAVRPKRVCASDGKTYYNKDMMTIAACKTRDYLVPMNSTSFCKK